MMIEIKSDKEMFDLAKEVALKLPFNFCIELIGDIGAGKTTFVKGLVGALDSRIEVSSPSFVINNRYQLNDQLVSHYDFYRLTEVGMDDQQLIDDLSDEKTGVIIEWAETVENILPKNRIQIFINYDQNDWRQVEIKGIKNV